MSNRPTFMGGVLLIGVVSYLAFLFSLALFAISAFLASVLTLLCGFAWKRPIRLFRFWITPPMAKEFIARGIAGAIMLPVFAWFAGRLLTFEVASEAWFYLVVGGYSLGSVGIAYWQLKLGVLHDVESVFEIVTDKPQIDLVREPHPQSLIEQTEPFRFADWNDEEEFK
ncbi:hypothetical protein [Aureimonas sp. ME7]|uniref:hypothetical protein n=1 Tax=Aureimonas sp. ME7 TaxID=2744252 RepID=UPI0015F3E243|nr:hypothetical protein [Aureimonas sp. ME7]